MSNYAWFNLKMLGFFALIGFACWWTDSAVPLLALLLAPSYKSGPGEGEKA